MKSSLNRLSQFWELILGVAVLWTTVFIIIGIDYQRTHHFTYALDDAYIHMAIAKNIALYGVWGVTPFGFSSSSSSLLWTILLAGIYKLFGIHEEIPLILNLIFASILLYVVYRITQKTHQVIRWAILLAVIFVTSLPGLILVGMEHTLHALLTLVFAYLIAQKLAFPEEKSSPGAFIVAPLLTATRYEGIFVVLIAGILLIWTQKWRGLFQAVTLGVLALLPILLYGLFSTSQGWFFFPNSVLLKGANFNFSSSLGIASFFGFRSLVHFTRAFPLLAMVMALALFLYWHQKLMEEPKMSVTRYMVLLALASIFLHMQYAQTGSFYRYEGYLMVLAIVSMGLVTNDLINMTKDRPLSYWAVGGIAILLSILPIGRAIEILSGLPEIMVSNFSVAYQMGTFIKTYYAGSAVALHDIGFVNFLAPIKLTDLAGLGDLEAAKTLIANNYGFLTQKQIQQLSTDKHVKIAIVASYGSMPESWIKVGEWDYPNSLFASNATGVSAYDPSGGLSIYAVNQGEAEPLRRNLKDFSTKLPDWIIQVGTYTQQQ